MRILHGVDLVSVDRIRKIVERHGKRGLRRLWSSEEIEDLIGEAVMASDDSNLIDLTPGQIASLAARFASREATVKALGTGFSLGIRMRDIHVSRDPLGAPTLFLTGRAAERAQELGVASWTLSLTHEAGLALASVVMVAKDPQGS